MHRLIVPTRAAALALLTVAAFGLSAERASAQQFYAGIAYSQSTGKIGYTARQARTEADVQRLAAANAGAPDAKTFIWGLNEWVAIAVVDGKIGVAGFARDRNPDQAQQKALAECRKRAKGEACRVALCIHSNGGRVQNLRSIDRDPSLPPPPPKSGFFAAIAFSPSTGKIGSSAGEGKTKEEAQALALKRCAARDAKVYMWGDQWVAIALAEGRAGTAGFGPGATRELAEKAALEQCRKFGNGAPCKVALVIHSSGKDPAAPAGATPAAGPTPPSSTTVLKPATPAAPAAGAPAPATPATEQK
jgi:hypothetical protein